MEYYKLTQDGFGSIDLSSSEQSQYKQQEKINPTVKAPEENDSLTAIIEKINSQFPDTFTEDDRVILEMLVNHVVNNQQKNSVLWQKGMIFRCLKLPISKRI